MIHHPALALAEGVVETESESESESEVLARSQLRTRQSHNHRSHRKQAIKCKVDTEPSGGFPDAGVAIVRKGIDNCVEDR
jgi:hypothetical protein